MPDERTIALYDAEADVYAEQSHRGRRYPRLERFIDALPPGARVLDLGCGPGTWAARMVERGLDVDALDASTGMAAAAKSAYGLDVRVGTFDDVTGENAYDGIWAHYSLLHAPRDALPRHLAALARALRRDGHFLIVMKLGEGEARDSKDRLYTYYTEPKLERLLTDAGFAITEREHGDDVGFDGSPHRYIVLHARKL
ncbi:class I SAM-dependent methyltransferase [Tropicimonas isoalkanivorans]|uniref:Methyltransferase domain-containing protein n=1 Tax=Tropicimonas isoalkanivorans TaxID=441112 RepID=A0A1I1PAT3_9RHOB|nr:class I SAM-dependent methyltransferase [Tropicimonas isoalkanivorans]SFD06909.1 Methyltransferase domain-containing protein [Tropicimonas isoalkanivorans]